MRQERYIKPGEPAAPQKHSTHLINSNMSGLEAGRRYKIINVKNPDCVLDLSGADNSSGMLLYSFLP